MVIDAPTFWIDVHPVSFLKFTRKLEEYSPLDNVRASVYSFSEPTFREVFALYLKRCQANSTLFFLDGSTEVLNIDIVKFLLDSFEKLDGLVIYTNGPDNSSVDLNTLEKLGAVVNVLPFFLLNEREYKSYEGSLPHEYKLYSLLTGTPKFERSVMVGLLSAYNILDKGHISYFGVHHNNVLQDHIKKIEKDSTCPPSLRAACIRGLSSITGDLIVDEPQFSHDLGVGRAYNLLPYRYSDIHIIMESHFFSDIAFYTEKIVKPVQQGNRLLLAWTPNKLSKVYEAVKKHMGKDIYHLLYWGDSNYDKEPNLYIRFNLICRELLKEL